MLIEVKVPELSESVAEATLLAWHKKVGEPVKRDENLIDIETDKVVLELPAPADGVLAKIIRADGGTVKAGEIIATIDTEGKVAVASAPAPVQTKPAPAPTAAAKPALAPAPAMPAARKIAEEKGIDTGMMAGSGRGGRVTKGDVLEPAACAHRRAPSAVAIDRRDPHHLQRSQYAAGGRPEKKIPGTLREGARRAPGLHVLLRQGGGACAQEIPDRQRLDRRQRYRLPRLLRHRGRRQQPAGPGRAGRARRGPDDVFRHRKENRRSRQARPGRQAHDRGADRRHFLDLERRSVRLDALHPHHQPAAVGDPGRARDARAARGRERPGRDPADQLPRAFLRSPHRRRPRGGAVARGDQGSARRSRAVAVRSLRPEPGRFYAQ